MTDEMMENQAQVPLGTRAGVFASAMATAGIVDVAGHLGMPGLVGGAFLAVFLSTHSPKLVKLRRRYLPSMPHGLRQIGQRLGNRLPDDGADDGEYEEELDEEDEELEAQPYDGYQDDGMFLAATARQGEQAIARLTVETIVRHVVRNSYTIYIGRSLTKLDNPVIPISIYKRHLKLIGASQKGKSSMAAALLDIITQTHDKEHVLIALLDLEDQTSNLFADVPNLAKINIDGKSVSLHARTREQVLEYLGYLVQIMDARYCLIKSEITHAPILLVYVEEFLALKDYYKRRIDAVKGEEKEQAKRDYSNLIYSISELARRGLKVRVQLLLCAQVDYRDEDLQEALINITSGMSFCVRVTAAQAAGFYNAELLKRNVLDDKVGQAVVEMPDCKDLVLAPEYDLEQRLIDLQDADEARAFWATTLRRVDSESFNVRGVDALTARMAPTGSNNAVEVTPDNVRTFPKNAAIVPAEPTDATSEERPEEQPDDQEKYRFTEAEIPQLVTAYKASIEAPWISILYLV